MPPHLVGRVLAVSRHIKILEARLQSQLFTRLPRYAIRLDLRAMPPPTLVAALAAHELDVAVTLACVPHKDID